MQFHADPDQLLHPDEYARTKIGPPMDPDAHVLPLMFQTRPTAEELQPDAIIHLPHGTRAR